MYKKIVFTICIISSFIVGFSGGSLILKNINPKNLTASVSTALVNNPCPKPIKEYSDMSLFDVGREIKLFDSTYTPSDLKELNAQSSIRKGICLKKETHDAFELMVAEAKKDGFLIKATSGYRSYDLQKKI